jgi:hypothetical protein
MTFVRSLYPTLSFSAERSVLCSANVLILEWFFRSVAMDNQQARETDKNREMDKNKDNARRGSEPMTGTAARSTPEGGDQAGGMSGGTSGTMEGTIEQAKAMARNVGEQARNMADNAGATAQDLARRAREQTDTLYRQGAQAGEYLTRNVNEYPLTALLIAGAVGYGLAYLVHSSWSNSDDERNERNSGRRHRD